LIKEKYYLRPEELPKVPIVLESLSSRFIRENRVIPLELKNSMLKVLMANPEDRATIDALRVATSADIVVYVSDATAVDEYISRFYGQESQNINKIIEDIGGRGLEFLREEEEDIGYLKDLASEAPIIKLVNLLITRAVEGRASDIHIEPFEDELKVRYRIDGVLHDIGFSRQTLSAFEQLIKRPNGIILVTGPTGSGKTTTLYGALDKINSPDRKIITVEDPVEYQLKGVNQIQVQPQIGLNFANTLRHIVRQDPDIIMIGEVRDLETAEIAIQSALTGHLVFSTLHTNDAPSAITRLLDMGVENFLLSSTIRGILAQRLVRVICPDCKEADPSTVDKEQLTMLGIRSDSTLYRGKRCEKCAFTGYHGRSGIFELLLVDEEIRKLILRSADSNQIREAARARGMKTLLEDGAEKVKAGMTTLTEVLRVTQEL
jgi:type II secretory ATPase GspE/PulE/Tfp pilus assembly ATPase PilB-like protein